MKKIILLLVVMLAIVGCETKDVPADEGKDKTPVIVERSQIKLTRLKKQMKKQL